MKRLLSLALVVCAHVLAQNAALMPMPRLTFLDSNGVPLSGGYLYTCVAGTSCTPALPGRPAVNPLATYTDASATVANANPIVLDAAGRANVWLGKSLYKIVVQDQFGVTQFSQDNVNAPALALTGSLAGANGAGLVIYTAAGTGAVSRTVAAKLGDVLSVKDYGANGSCSTPHDDTTALLNAVSDINAGTYKTLRFPSGCYYINPMSTPHSGQPTEFYGFDVTVDDVTIAGDAGAVLATYPGISYDVTYPAPQNTTVKWWFIRLRGSRGTVRGLTFVGNGANVAHSYSGTTGLFWIDGVKLTKRVDTANGDGNSVLDNKFVPMNGWAVMGEYQTGPLISGNYATKSEGMGFDGSVTNGTISNNISYNGLDAHFFSNGSYIGGVNLTNSHILIDGNTADTNDNGSGIDVTDSVYTTVANNYVTNNKNWCVLVDKTSGPFASNPSTDQPSSHIKVDGNTCVNNLNYTGWTNSAEIVVGDTNTGLTAGQAATYVDVVNNHIVSQISQGIGIETSWGASHVKISNNYISGCGGTPWGACATGSVIRIFDRAGADIAITDNHQDNAYAGTVQVSTIGPYEVWGNNMNTIFGGAATWNPALFGTGATVGTSAQHQPFLLHGSGTVDDNFTVTGTARANGFLTNAGVSVAYSLSAATSNIGGSSVAAGACTSGTVTVTGANQFHAFTANPTTYPGDSFEWSAYWSATNTVTVRVCNRNTIAATPAAASYVVRDIN